MGFGWFHVEIYVPRGEPAAGSTWRFRFHVVSYPESSSEVKANIIIMNDVVNRSYITLEWKKEAHILDLLIARPSHKCHTIIPNIYVGIDTPLCTGGDDSTR